VRGTHYWGVAKVFEGIAFCHLATYALLLKRRISNARPHPG
jgi:hypothetical protein